MNLKQLIQQQGEEFDKEFRHQEYCEHRDDAYKGCICGNDEIKSFLHFSQQAILQAVVEDIKTYRITNMGGTEELDSNLYKVTEDVIAILQEGIKE